MRKTALLPFKFSHSLSAVKYSLCSDFETFLDKDKI